MASGSNTPSSAPTSVTSYSSRDVKDQCDWQKAVQKTLKAEQLRMLLRSKNIKPKGLKPDLAQAVAWNFTKAEVDGWLAQQEAALQPPALLVSRGSLPPQPTLHQYFGSA